MKKWSGNTDRVLSMVVVDGARKIPPVLLRILLFVGKFLLLLLLFSNKQDILVAATQSTDGF